jgi:hypothetical protein
MAGQLAFDSGLPVGTEHLRTVLKLIGRGGFAGVNCGVGFLNPCGATAY